MSLAELPAHSGSQALRDVEEPTLERLLGRYQVVSDEDRGPIRLLFLAGLASADTSAVVRIAPQGGESRLLFELHRHLGAHGDDPLVARPLAWGTNPEFFAYEFLPGMPVKRRIEMVVERSHDYVDEVAALGRQAGALLARYHAAFDPPGDERPTERRVARVSRRLARADSRSRRRVVRSLGDPGPHNLIIDDSDVMRMIDLEPRTRWTYAESDVGTLAHRFARRAANAAGLNKRTARLRGAVAAEVVDGYRTNSDVELDPVEVTIAFAASSAAFAARSARRGHPDWSLRQAVRDASWWASTERGAAASRR